MAQAEVCPNFHAWLPKLRSSLVYAGIRQRSSPAITTSFAWITLPLAEQQPGTGVEIVWEMPDTICLSLHFNKRCVRSVFGYTSWKPCLAESGTLLKNKFCPQALYSSSHLVSGRVRYLYYPPLPYVARRKSSISFGWTLLAQVPPQSPVESAKRLS